ncbi:ribonuclease E inhibitor RraB [Pseudoxanthomonas gei]|uniref:Ribonuclease E inhibitor RraB n=1 Tax=Pseudoxanthomonas gei TaxID=1383030 RepID=A0ABX0AG28_9GAMM|nr:ribonuclease E inhibitor RraB [Pseudoxanthomonas gei]NDK38456.1 ribonuclease E inhibitor RraB [Pseudoxanthomonas gei]
MGTKACLGVLLLLLSSVCAAQSAAEQADARVIANLVAAGSDTSKPHDIDFFIFFPSRSQARLAAADIEQLGYVVASIDEPPANQSQWQLHATRRMAPQLEAMTSTTRTLEALALKYGGDYDGWGTGVVK